jgi:multidrug efflux pump subunit AcrA (membrane-fusion protein)
MKGLLNWLWQRPWIAVVGLLAAALVAFLWLSRPAGLSDPAFTTVVTRGTLVPRLTSSGILRPVQSVTYRSPLGGRDTEIIFLVAEGTRVSEGDLLVRLDSTELEQDFERATVERRQAQVDLQVADIDRQQAQASLDSVTEGEGAIEIEEAATRLQLAEKKVTRLREELAELEPLMDKGYITREEYRRTADGLEQAEEELALARRRSEVLIGLTYPQERRRAELLRAQKESQYENVRARLQDVDIRLQRLALQIEACSMYARRPGLVVYEEYLSASPRRKVRLGDRVTGSQGLVTIPDVDRMVVETSVTEADVHRVRPGLEAVVRLEAFPGMRFPGQVTVIGTLARSSIDRTFDDKRFDVVVALEPTTADLRPEMTARADILLGDRPDALLVPVNAVFDHDGQFVAHVVGRFGVDTRPVELGETDDDVVEILSGLAEGDRVSLSDVAVSQPVGQAPAPSGPDPAGQARPVKGGGS